MPKLKKDFPEQINILTVAGTTENLVAIAYYRGNGGQYAAPARDFIDRGIRDFIESLSEKEKIRFNEILRNVKTVREL